MIIYVYDCICKHKYVYLYIILTYMRERERMGCAFDMPPSWAWKDREEWKPRSRPSVMSSAFSILKL